MPTSTTEAPVSTGNDVQRQMTTMRIRCVARYKLTAVPGRAEELVSIQQKHLGISFGYGCKTIRVRTMVGRTWTDRVDFQIKEGWGAELYAFLDRHFGPPQPTPESIRKPYPYHNFSS